MRRIILTCLICMISFFAYADGKPKFREGDIIFQTSKSNQSKFIAYATHSTYTHCGIVVYKGDKPYVLEASNVIKVTPLDAFIKKGVFKSYTVMRYTDKPVKIAYKKYLGIPYDSAFRWGNSKYYCSELVWVIYKKQLGVELCQPQPLKNYTTFGLQWLLKKRGIRQSELFVAPSDLAESKKLHEVE